MLRTLKGFPLAALSLLPARAFAQAWGQTGVIPNFTLSGCDFSSGQHTAACIPNFIAHLITLIFYLIGGFFIINVIIAGYQIALGSVSGSGTSAGKERIIWAIIGFTVTVCAFLIFDAVIIVFTS